MSTINTYEGTWQFLPFMWGNGGTEQDITTPATEQALRFPRRSAERRVDVAQLDHLEQDDVIDQFHRGQGGDGGQRAVADPGAAGAAGREVGGVHDSRAGRGAGHGSPRSAVRSSRCSAPGTRPGWPRPGSS
ncbi:hypothetical protein [Nonomuraea rubra]|uniref:hypothetical protein n=1 Tax=Nonomuraea rubra TaxID=46180 RepID=UPI0031EE0F9F